MQNQNEESSATQKSQIRAWLMEGNSVTPIEALNKWGCFRLASVINRLRNEGMDIITETVNNGRKSFAKYYLKKITQNGNKNL